MRKTLQKSSARFYLSEAALVVRFGRSTIQEFLSLNKLLGPDLGLVLPWLSVRWPS
jgi:hypothetical protein